MPDNSKGKQILIFLFLVSCFVILSSVVSAKEKDPFIILKKEKIGNLKQGLNEEKVLKMLAKPEKQSDVIFEAATGLYVKDWDYPKKGIHLKMSSGKKEGKFVIDAILIKHPCKLKTLKGIGIGSRYEDVKKAYSGFSFDKEHTSDDMIIVGSIYGGLFFSFKNGKVTEIFMGAGAE